MNYEAKFDPSVYIVQGTFFEDSDTSIFGVYNSLDDAERGLEEEMKAQMKMHPEMHRHEHEIDEDHTDGTLVKQVDLNYTAEPGDSYLMMWISEHEVA